MKIRVVGRLRVFAVNRRFTDLIVDQQNLVVTAGFEAVCALLGGGLGSPTIGGAAAPTGSAGAIAQMHLSNTVGPAAPALGDTSLMSDRVYAFIAAGTPPLAVSYPAAGTVRFTGSLPAGTPFANPITQEALVTNLGILFAKIKLTTPVNRTTGTGLTFAHDITFAPA